MKVWIVNHYAVPPSIASGMVRHYYFSKYLKESGVQTNIITAGKIHNTSINMIPDDSLYCYKEMDGVGYTFVSSRDYKGNGIDRMLNLIDFPFKIKKTMKILLKKERPDVIYTSSPDIFVAFSALRFGKKYHIPVVFEVRDLWPESIVEYNNMSRKNPIIKALYILEKWMYQNANQLIFTIPGGKDYIKDKRWDNKINLDKVNYVNNGVDLKRYRADIEENQITDIDLDSDKFKVVYMGSIRKVNNIQALVDVAEELKRQSEEDIVILIYGDGTEKEELERISKEKQLDNIVFKGKVEKKHIPYILSKSNLNILNYRQSATWKYGGSQNKQFEYLASGRPICSNVKMGHSIIRKFDCGIEENIVEKEQYIDIILRYRNMDKDEYESQCRKALKASKDFDYEKLGYKIKEILEKAKECR